MKPKKKRKSKFKKELDYIIKQDREILKSLADNTTQTEIKTELTNT